jgi:hypothetical protein
MYVNGMLMYRVYQSEYWDFRHLSLGGGDIYEGAVCSILFIG